MTAAGSSITQGTTYLVTDIEADGLVPGVNSMISIASVAVDHDGRELSSFTINLDPVEGTTPDPDAMEWWESQPAAWKAATVDPVEPRRAMGEFIAWAERLPDVRVFVAHPLSFDGSYIAWYMDRFAHLPLIDRPRQRGLTTGGLDLNTLVMGVTGWGFDRCNRGSYPPEWLGGHDHSHRALDDALGYAHLLRTMLQAIKRDG